VLLLLLPTLPPPPLLPAELLPLNTRTVFSRYYPFHEFLLLNTAAEYL
jgi:hypothetical protein